MNIKDNYDLIIVGGGAAGMTAAYEASEKGLSTLVVEKGINLAVQETTSKEPLQ